jgi:YD repeat-containing protein
MRKAKSCLAAFVLILMSTPLLAQNPHDGPVPEGVSFTTLITTPRAIEGLTGDNGSNLYTAASGAPPCPLWQINIHRPSLTVVGNVPASLSSSCTFRGVALDAAGRLYALDQTLGVIYRVTPNASAPPDASVYATGVPGTNGIVFDRQGNLWTGDGLAAQGRVWKITGPGANCAPPNPLQCTEVFRVQPMRNSTALGGTVAGDGIGRQNRVLPPGTLTIASGSFPVTPAGGQDLVANGLEFDREGNLFIIDTARGALWRVTFDAHGRLTSPTGCDRSFTANTLCLSNVLVASPVLEGGDGIILDVAGNIWVSVNERNAIAMITKAGGVVEVFRNPLNAQGLRNSADPSVGNEHILEFPTSPVLNGTVFCTANSDMDRRDNSPASAGEGDGVTVLGKISCMDQPAVIPGLPLPVH